jgi:transposase InsO family protein
MRYSQAEKLEIIRLVEESELPVKRTLDELEVPRSTFYRWYDRYQAAGYDGLADQKPGPQQFWNRIPDSVRQQVVEVALERPDQSPRQLAWHLTDTEGYFISETSVYRILKSFDLITSPVFDVVKASDKFENPTKRVNELWQTDFTQFKVYGWGWYYLCPILDDFSRYILAWRLSSTMAATDVQETLQMAIDKTGVDHIQVEHHPRLLADNGPAFIADALKDFLKPYDIDQIHGRPFHPQTQGKIERYHRSMKSIILLNTFFFPWELEHALADFVVYYNTQRYHESLDNLTPEDVYLGRTQEVLTQREYIKQQTLQQRRNAHLQTVIQAF